MMSQSTSRSTFSPSPAQQRAMAALERGDYFKLICGGALTDLESIAALIHCYAPLEGVHCIDLAPEMGVLETVEEIYQELAVPHPLPLVMVSLPLDPDPHFRKIELVNTACIACNACIPVCPTVALAEGQAPTVAQIEINGPLCYGCGRCVDICPTEALTLFPIYQDQAFEAILAHPLVEAVELHTRYADPYMLKDFLAHFAPRLENKLISVCFRPDQIDEAQWLPFLETLQAHSKSPLILQADGKPMSGTDAPDSSLAALHAAKFLYGKTKQYEWITLSGGINTHTASYLKDPAYPFIRGIGMGTFARQAIQSAAKENNIAEGQKRAETVVNPFRKTPALLP